MIKSILVLLLLVVSLQDLRATEQSEEPEMPAPAPISAQQMIKEHLQQREQAEQEAEVPVEEEALLEEEFPAAVEAEAADVDELLLLPEDDDGLELTAATETVDIELQQTYEKVDSMPPALLIRGTPGVDEDAAQKKEDIVGRFVPEPHPLNRRQRFYRWVLETFEGHRIPLKSNLKLLQEIRSEKFLDGYVKLRGYYLESGFNEQLKYFVVESVAAHDGPDGFVEPAVVEEVAPASFTLRDKIRR